MTDSGISDSRYFFQQIFVRIRGENRVTTARHEFPCRNSRTDSAAPASSPVGLPVHLVASPHLDSVAFCFNASSIAAASLIPFSTAQRFLRKTLPQSSRSRHLQRSAFSSRRFIF